MLRINKDGSAPADNPFFSEASSEQRKRVWAYGLRNPYTFSFQPVTGKLFVNEVGQNAVEEINDATTGGKNFGWPSAEGASTNPAFSNPVYAYNHSGAAPIGCAITGGDFFNPQFTTYPVSYIGKYFFLDYCSNWIYALDLSGTPTATLFASNIGSSSLSIMTGPDGNLYYLSRGAQAVFKITSTNSTIPVIAQHPLPATIQTGDPVTFSVSATGTAPLSYQWQKGEINIEGATESSYTINSVQPEDAGAYRVIITNIAGQVISQPATLAITLNEKPIAVIISPTENSTYVAGTSVSFSGSATDPEEGVLASAVMSWQISFHHDDHKHDEPPREGISEGNFDIPDEGETSANVWYRFILSVTDSEGSVGRDTVDVHPETSVINFFTIPPGLQISLDGQPQVTPLSVESVEGMKRQIGGVDDQTLDNNNFVFMNWLHGGSKSQTIITPSDDVTYTANYDLVLGLDENTHQVFPNPVKDWVYLSVKNISEVVIIDTMGRRWHPQIEVQPEKSIVDVRDMPAGFYFLSFTSQESVIRIKLLIQR